MEMLRSFFISHLQIGTNAVAIVSLISVNPKPFPLFLQAHEHKFDFGCWFAILLNKLTVHFLN